MSNSLPITIHTIKSKLIIERTVAELENYKGFYKKAYGIWNGFRNAINTNCGSIETSLTEVEKRRLMLLH